MEPQEMRRIALRNVSKHGDVGCRAAACDLGCVVRPAVCLMRLYWGVKKMQLQIVTYRRKMEGSLRRRCARMKTDL